MHRVPLRIWKLSLLAASVLGTPVMATAQEISPDPAVDDEAAATDKGESVQDTIVVTGNRTGAALADTPRAVLSIDTETIDFYANQSGNLSETLGKAIPGFGFPVYQNSLRSLTLRGREALLLLDGVPLQSNSGFFAELGSVEPSAIGRTEVLFGPTALYGRGATGGVIQFFTRDPADEDFAADIALTGRSNLGNNSFDEDSLSFRGSGGVSGRAGAFDGIFRFGYERQGGQFDANGDRIAPTGLDDTGRLSFFAKAGVDLGAEARLEGWIANQQTRYNAFDFTSAVVDGVAVAVPVAQPVSFAEEPSQDTFIGNLVFTHDDVFGARLRLQGYHRDSELVQIASDIRALPLPPIFPDLFQTNLDTDEQGLRADLTIPVSTALEIAVGGDYSTQFNSRPLLISSVSVFEATGEFDASTRVVQTPTFDLDSLGLFAQATLRPTDRLTVVGGVRWDDFDYNVEPYDVVFGAQGQRPGGAGSADGMSWNLGATYEVLPSNTLFVSYAQGFSIPELGFAANQILPGVPISGSAFVAPIEVESFEGGLRGGFSRVAYSVAAFYARSDNGASSTVDPSTGIAELVRAPQRNYGVEASLEAAVTDDLDLGVALGWNEGENDANDDGVFRPLGSVQIPPLKLSFTGAWRPLDRLEITSQVLVAGDRDRAFDDGVDSFRIEGYTTVDLGASYDTRAGRWELQVLNLLDNFYLPVESQSRFGNTANRRFAAPGRTLALTWSQTF